jgi:hypothetical protein
MELTVPAPQLSQQGATGNTFASEQPIALTCEPVTFPDGTVLNENTARVFGFLLYRENPSLGLEVWDEKGLQWVPVSGTESSSLPEYQTLFRQNEQWQTLLVAIGQTDQAGNAKFAEDSSQYQYFVRCFFEGKRDDRPEVEFKGSSPASSKYRIQAVGQQDRAGLKMNPPSPREAREVRLFLKDSALLAERGKVVIREIGGTVIVEVMGNQVELIAGGARVTLETDGDIILDPAPGRQVRVRGNLQVEGLINGLVIPSP